jgi:hypothetical protein
MKEIGIVAAELLVTGLIVCAGLSSRHIPLIGEPRAAAITLGIVGFAICMIMPTIGKFISSAPAHPLTIIGCILGAIALLAVVAQIFRWSIPVVNDPKAALFIIAGCIAIKSIISRFAYLTA